MVPYINGLLNSVMGKHPDLILKVQPQQLAAGLMGGVRSQFERTFDLNKIKPFGKDHRPDPRDTTTTEAVKSVAAILLQAAKTATDQKADTEWFQYAPLPDDGGPAAASRREVAFAGTEPEQFDDQKAYGSLLMKLSSLRMILPLPQGSSAARNT